MLQFSDLVGLVMVPLFDACLCSIWWLCVVMLTLSSCTFVIVLITCQRAEKRCHFCCWNVSGKCEWIHKAETQMISSLTVHPTFRRQAKFCVKPFLWHIAFMVASISCPSSLIYQNWTQFRWENWKFLFCNWCHANSYFSPLFYKLTDCIMCLDQVQTKVFMHTSWLRHQQRIFLIGLLRGTGTRFATWFYALHCLLHQMKAHLATIKSP